MKLNLDYKKIWSEVITASLIIIISAIAIISFIMISNQNVDIYNPSAKVQVSVGSNKIEEVLNLLQSKYMGELEIDKLVDGAIAGIFEQIEDPYTRYLSEEEYLELVSETGAEYSGIGIHIAPNTKTETIQIVGVMKDSPAEKAGIKAGDVILAVDGKTAEYKDYANVCESIRGKKDTIVEMKVKRANKQFTFSIIRDNIIPINVESHIISEDIGYIRVFEFSNDIYEEFKRAYDEINSNKLLKGLIIDLRNNPGGAVVPTVKIADLFTSSGIILKSVYGDNTVRIDDSTDGEYGKPLVILINQNSASASEILASCLKDLDKATLVGTTSFGKGIIQSVIALSDGAGGVSITTAKYYTAAGKEIHGIGVEPDIEVVVSDELASSYVLDEEQDSQLKEAIKEIYRKANEEKTEE